MNKLDEKRDLYATGFFDVLQGKDGKVMLEKQRENIKELFGLIKENPGLPIIPMVDAEIIGDDCGYWAGSFGSAYIDKYFLDDDHAVVFYEENDPDIVDIFEKFFDYAECGIDEEMPDNEALLLIKQKIDTLNWKRAIVIHINLPE